MDQATLQPGQPVRYTSSSKVIGFKGLEALALAIIIGVLLLVSTLTSFTNLLIIYRLRLFPNLEIFTFNEDGSLVFNGEVNLGRINLFKNVLSGVSKIKGDVSLEAGSSSYLHLNSEGLQIGSPEGFKVYSKSTNRLLFPPDFTQLPLNFVSTLSVTGGIRNVHKIRSPTDSDLTLSSSGSITISGNEGVTSEAKQINLASPVISLSSHNGSIVLQGDRGITINPNRMLISPGSAGDETDANRSAMALQYKLCVCGRNGRLFRIKVKSPDQGCADVRFPESSNPCS